jgi:predicted patatin/cPLA2 family phospholipase
MSINGELDIVWEKLNTHQKEMADVQSKLKVHDIRHKQHEVEIKRLSEQMNIRHGEITTKLDSILKELTDNRHKDAYIRGLNDAKKKQASLWKWLVPIILTTVTVTIGILEYFNV